MSEATEWYWDLNKRIAVPGEDRGPGDHMMGPYPTKGQAENWKATVDARNDTWDDDDEKWENSGDRSTDGA